MIFTPTIEGDRVIAPDIDIIKKTVEGRCYSCILFGSYGKGEGAVIEGKPTNDYDILIASPKPGLIEELKSKVSLVEVHILKQGDDILPTQQWFEIRYASQLLAGSPLDLPLWMPYEIPFSDAIHSLERRAISMLVGKHEMMKENGSPRKCIEQIAKGIIAVGDAVLIKRGEFHPKYTMRAMMLETDEIGNLYKMAVSLKIFNRPDMNPDLIWQLWNTARGVIRQYCIDNRITGDALEYLFSWSELQTKEELHKKLHGLGVEGRWL